jgi:hypothetical protein
MPALDVRTTVGLMFHMQQSLSAERLRSAARGCATFATALTFINHSGGEDHDSLE